MRFVTIYLLLSTALLGGARAESPLAVLVLPTQLGGSVPERAAWQKDFDDRVEAAVRRSGRTPRPSGPITIAEATCREAACLERLAEAAGVQMVIVARLVADRGTPPSYRMSVLRFDRDRAASLRQQEGDCIVCTQPEAAERLERMLSQALPSLVVQPRRSTPSEPAPMLVPAAPPASRLAAASHARGAFSRVGLLGLVGATAAVGAAGLVLLGFGGRAVAIDGQPASALPPGASQAALVYDTRSSGVGLLIGGTVLLLGAGVGLGFEIVALRRRGR